MNAAQNDQGMRNGYPGWQCHGLVLGGDGPSDAAAAAFGFQQDGLVTMMTCSRIVCKGGARCREAGPLAGGLDGGPLAFLADGQVGHFTGHTSESAEKFVCCLDPELWDIGQHLPGEVARRPMYQASATLLQHGQAFSERLPWTYFFEVFGTAARSLTSECRL